MRNRKIDFIKGLFIISVFVAHLTYKQLNNTEIIAKIFISFKETISIIGVPGFLFISGFLYDSKKYDFRNFFAKKVRRILMPWIIWGSVVFIVSSFFGERIPINITQFFAYLIGYKTLYYYNTVLIFLYIVFFRLKINKNRVMIFIALNLLSIVANLPIGTVYLNPLNWIGFFALGIFYKSYKEKIDLSLSNRNTTIYIMFILALIIRLIAYYKEISGFAYFSVDAFMFELTCLLIVIKVINNKAIIRFKSLERLGEKSFFVYLTHLPVAGILNILIPSTIMGFFFKLIIITVVYKIILDILQKLKIDFLI